MIMNLTNFLNDMDTEQDVTPSPEAAIAALKLHMHFREEDDLEPYNESRLNHPISCMTIGGLLTELEYRLTHQDPPVGRTICQTIFDAV